MVDSFGKIIGQPKVPTKINTNLIVSSPSSTGEQTYRFIDKPNEAGMLYYQLEDISLDGTSTLHDPVNVRVSTEVALRNTAPTDFELHQNFPNPFNPQTTIRFALPAPSEVLLVIYDARGRQVRTLVDDRLNIGIHTLIWDGRNDFGNAVASGLYFYRIRAGEFNKIKKMTFLK